MFKGKIYEKIGKKCYNFYVGENMKKLFRFLFSRFTIGAVLIILQVLWIILWLNVAYQVYSWMQFVIIFLELLLIIDLSNRDMSADLKIPWLAVVMLVPVAGIIIYLLFSRNMARKKDRRFSKELFVKTQETISDFEQDSKMLGEKYEGQSNYIKHTCNCGLFVNTKTKYFDCGETFFKDYVEDLKKAEKFIFMEYYILSYGVMLNTILDILKEKAKNGVEVRLMYDDIGSISYLPFNFARSLRKEGINCIKFHPFLPFVTALHNNRDHRKITVIDGKIGYVGGINIADEYINEIKRFGYWKDSTIRLEGDATRQLTVMFLQTFNLQRRQKEDYQQYTQIDFEPVEGTGFVQPLCDGPSPIYRELICENAYLNMINQAKKSVWITTPYLIIDTQTKTSLINAAKRGVRVKIFTPHIPDKKIIFALTRSNYRELINNGVEIYEYRPGFIHTKNFLVDDEIAIVGTINLDYRSLVHHYECGVWMYQTESIKELQNDFENILNDSIYIDPKTFKLKFSEKIVAAVLKIFSPIL